MKQPEKFPAHEELLLYINAPEDIKYRYCLLDKEKLNQEFNTLLTDRQADEKLIRELVWALERITEWRKPTGGMTTGDLKDNPIQIALEAIARAQTRLGGEAPFETDNQNLINDI